MVKSEGNRCMRNCHNCPICTSPLQVSGIEFPLSPDANATPAADRWDLNCPYCLWTSQEIGITFEKPNSIGYQLKRMRNGDGAETKPWLEMQRERDKRRRERHAGPQSSMDGSRSKEGEEAAPPENRQMEPAEQYAALRSFYASQMVEAGLAGGLDSTPGYGSPATLNRIMGLYSGISGYGLKKERPKPAIMREAPDAEEGLQLLRNDDAVIQQMREVGFAGTTTLAQRAHHPHPPHFLSSLRPQPTLLRSKRSKRCRSCRHILVKPESKVTSARFRIRLVATAYMPKTTLSPFPSSIPPSTLSTSTPPKNLIPLRPYHPTQFLLTLTNPSFNPIHITLGTPPHIPGPHPSKVTILCPTFDVGQNSDVWDEALATGRHERGLRAEALGETERVAEAGKVWAKGRNWTSVVVEVVPGAVAPADGGGEGEGEDEDADVLEVPVFVRVESEGAEEGEEKGGKCELAYWCVLGVGRIAG
ncbi:MAG: hypothetical protein M1824_004156 [Vezdaea acicularis]|nr:MAG: hypothetical protein M1824_004156 [Vezdaea acicularis]